jgi:hypothetical protein
VGHETNAASLAACALYISSSLTPLFSLFRVANFWNVVVAKSLASSRIGAPSEFRGTRSNVCLPVCDNLMIIIQQNGIAKRNRFDV